MNIFVHRPAGPASPPGRAAAHRRRLPRLAGLAVVGGLLSGCGVPIAVTVVSYAADGVSAIATGKTLGDHALSAAVGEDCALWRVFDDEEICIEVEERMWAVADPAVLAAAPAGAQTDPRRPAGERRIVLPADAPAAAVAALTRPPQPVRLADAGVPTTGLVASAAGAAVAPAIDPPLPPQRPVTPTGDTAERPAAVPLPPILPPRRLADLAAVPLPPDRPPYPAPRQLADARF